MMDLVNTDYAANSMWYSSGGFIVGYMVGKIELRVRRLVQKRIRGKEKQ